MKKSTYILGLINLAALLLASTFKIMHWPVAGILFTISLVTMAVVFLPIAYAQLCSTTADKLLKLVYLSALISFAFDFVGALFKVMHWPGSNTIMIIAIPLPFVLFLPIYIHYHNKRKLKTDWSFLGITVFMIYLAVFSAMLAINPGYEVLKSTAHSSNTISDGNIYLKKAIKTDKLQLVNDLEQMKISLIESVNNEPMPANAKFALNYLNINAKDKLLNPHNFKQAGFDVFMSDFSNYKNKLADDKEFKRLIKEIELDILPSKIDGIPQIMKMNLISALQMITDWQNKLLLIEYLSQTRQKVSK